VKRWLLLAFLAACAGKAVQQTAAPTMAPTRAVTHDPHPEIERLSAEIDRETQQQATPTPGVAHPMSAGVMPVTNDQTCKPAPTDTCTDSCNLASSICDNAKKICDLANDLQGDAWAADKCSSATKSCDSARGKCCGCQ
jgi:hypothetical protein